MTHDEVIKMAIDCLLISKTKAKKSEIYAHALVDFAELVAAAEREECAKVAEKTVCDTHLPTGIKIYGTNAARAIRAHKGGA